MFCFIQIVFTVIVNIVVYLKKITLKKGLFCFGFNLVAFAGKYHLLSGPLWLTFAFFLCDD